MKKKLLIMWGIVAGLVLASAVGYAGPARSGMDEDASGARYLPEAEQVVVEKIVVEVAPAEPSAYDARGLV